MHRYVQCSVLDVVRSTLRFTYLLTARRGHSLASTTHRVDGELNRLAAEMGCKEGGTGTGLGHMVQARLPPIPRAKPVTGPTM